MVCLSCANRRLWNEVVFLVWYVLHELHVVGEVGG